MIDPSVLLATPASAPTAPATAPARTKKDQGADVDLLGPGPAYERWKKTPQYQQWLKETEQKK